MPVHLLDTIKDHNPALKAVASLFPCISSCALESLIIGIYGVPFEAHEDPSKHEEYHRFFDLRKILSVLWFGQRVTFHRGLQTIQLNLSHRLLPEHFNISISWRDFHSQKRIGYWCWPLVRAYLKDGYSLFVVVSSVTVCYSPQFPVLRSVNSWCVPLFLSTP